MPDCHICSVHNCQKLKDYYNGEDLLGREIDECQDFEAETEE